MLGLKQALEKDITMQEKLIARDAQQILLLPNGKLKLSNSGNSISLLGDGNHYRVLDSNSELLTAIRKKHFFSTRLLKMKENVLWEKKLLSHYSSYDMYSINDLLSKAYRLDFDSFITTTYERTNTPSSFHSESLIHPTSNGSFRRSKSEQLISLLYDEYRIPYEYEPTLAWPKGHMSDEAEALKTAIGLPDYIRPDFKLSEPSGRTVYHEHCGMIGDPTYLQNLTKKILFYHLLGYTIGDNLIITADNIDGTLNQRCIIDIIETRFMNRRLTR